MAILSKGINFSTGEQVTADKLDALVDSATFVGGAVDNSSTQLSGGAIIVKDSGITTNKIASGVNISFNDGSAASPSITNNGDTNTGIFFPNDDQVAITAGGYTAAVFAFNEQGGEIQLTDSSGNGNLLIDNLIGTGRLLKVGSGSLQLGTTGAGIVTLHQGDVRRMTIANEGNVGIGTDSPANKLDVNGNISVPEGVLKPIVRATQKSASGEFIDFTNIPSWVKRITVVLINVSTNGGDEILIQLGTAAGGVNAGGYFSEASDRGTDANSSSGFVVTTAISLSSTIYGTVIISNVFGNTWSSFGNVSSGTITSSSVGSKELNNPLATVRITTIGTDDFDSGTVNIMYE